MPRRTALPVVKRKPSHIRAWRVYRGLSSKDFARQLGSSLPSLSRLENGHQAYTQDVIEKAAHLLGCEVADLVSRRPEEIYRTAAANEWLPKGYPEELWSAWKSASAQKRRLLERVLQAVVG